MAEEAQDKTEQKSQKKWEKARDRGELPRSQEIATFAVFAAVLLYFSAIRVRWFDVMGSVMRDLLAFDRHLGLRGESLDDFLLQPVLKIALALSPFFVVVLLVSVFTNMSQTGFQFAKERLRIDFERLDPVRGAKKFVSLRSWVEGLKSLFKIVLFALLAFLTIRGVMSEIAELPAHDLRYQINFLLYLALRLGTRVAILMAVLAVGDYLFQWWQFQEKLKMTPREVKEEAKEHEGDPLVRQRMRSLRMEMARRRMMDEVPKADVVVTNPTQYAVALKFDREKMPAPFVTAKGAQHMARRIREVAMAHGVPIVENPPIARALFRKVRIGHPVPSEFYRVVAELLAFVYLLSRDPGRAARARAGRPFRPRLKASPPQS